MTDEPVHSEPPEDETSPAEDGTEADSPAVPEEKKNASPVRGFLDLLLILILAGLAGASYLLYEMQKKQQAEIMDQIKKIENQQADLSSALRAPQSEDKTKQLQQELDQLRNQYREDLDRQQQALESMRQQLEQEIEESSTHQTAPSTAPTPPQATQEDHAEVRPEPDTSGKNGAEDEYVDFVESTFAKLWRLFKEGVANLIDQIGRLIRGD